MYEHEGQAYAEATRYSLRAEQISELRALVDAKRDQLGPEGVRAHRVRYNPDNWAGLIPAALTDHEMISRGDVFDLAKAGDLQGVFGASFLWGSGLRGYGPHRLRSIVDSTNGRLSHLLAQAASAAAHDVIDGYAMLYGGYEPKTRAAPNTAPWTRIDNFGPAFFTKFLYFVTDRGLILDNVLARKVHSISAMPHLVDSKGRSLQWSPYRYCVYLHWMELIAGQIQCTADELEVTLFSPPGPA
ncbi:MAG: hypothetical protein WBH51_15610 [Mycolicibacter algericus]|uniref:8-oxoguanine DNA glycosylase OGG fold protein n=1 Tax=Mycolicibacter algericus TaxID=1288388 RepID=UPI003C7225BF